jgi:choline kinase
LRVIILAAGYGTRGSTNHVPDKMVFQIKGEPIICRQIRLLGSFGFTSPLIVVRKDNDKLLSVLPQNVVKVHTDTDHKNTLNELRATERYWNDTTLILLGDLTYSKRALRQMIEGETPPITVFGFGTKIGPIQRSQADWCDHAEVYAIKISRDHIREAIEKINALPFVHYNLWNIPLGLNIPIVQIRECKDIDFETDFDIVTKLVSTLGE